MIPAFRCKPRWRLQHPGATPSSHSRQPPDLDFTTFEPGDLGFGTTTVEVPTGRKAFSTRIDARATLGLFVDVSVGINLSSGLVTWTFTSLDPATLDLPFDARAGFLPPNDAAGSGVAFVRYTVRPKPGRALASQHLKHVKTGWLPGGRHFAFGWIASG